MPPWQSRKKCSVTVSHAELAGEWLDVGEGDCERCHVVRRLYKPMNLTERELLVCAPCSQIYSTSSIMNDSREDDCEEEAA